MYYQPRHESSAAFSIKYTKDIVNIKKNKTKEEKDKYEVAVQNWSCIVAASRPLTGQYILFWDPYFIEYGECLGEFQAET